VVRNMTVSFVRRRGFWADPTLVQQQLWQRRVT
jgi:hypothetical protein